MRNLRKKGLKIADVGVKADSDPDDTDIFVENGAIQTQYEMENGYHEKS